jgi:UDP-2-acetamido-2,6-beta-L-arabino-hexul-4-ose reductase
MKKTRVGITGKNGFVGYHLLQTIKLNASDFELVYFERSYFNNPLDLDSFVSNCDCIVHLAGLNRHIDPQVIYDTNTELTKKLIESLIRTNSTPQIIFSSSTQEERDNLYGQSKKKSRELLAEWARKSKAFLCGLIIPNVYGPFGEPKYNSVVATFCHQLANGEKPLIQVDGEMKLIYVGELVEKILEAIINKENNSFKIVNHSAEAFVSEILNLLKIFKTEYQDKGIIPEIASDFEHKLFNTYRCYMPNKHYFPRKFVTNEDNRGCFVELARLGIGGQVSYSTTIPGITRGNHFHTRKIERFAVLKGKARIQLRRIGTSEVLEFFLDGDTPSHVDMPIWYTHNITNVGNDELITVFWINEPYDSEDSDTWFEAVE